MPDSQEKRGGARPGSGPKPALIDVPETDDPYEFLLSVMNDPNIAARTRIDAAKGAALIKRASSGYVGKKEERASEAKEAARGKFETPAAPRLKVVAQ